MKDLPHHMNKLNRKVIRSSHREMTESEDYSLKMERPERQIKKQKKAKIAKKKNARNPHVLTPDEQNKKMRERVPVFDRFGEKPRITKPTQKKTPRI